MARGRCHREEIVVPILEQDPRSLPRFGELLADSQYRRLSPDSLDRAEPRLRCSQLRACLLDHEAVRRLVLIDNRDQEYFVGNAPGQPFDLDAGGRGHSFGSPQIGFGCAGIDKLHAANMAWARQVSNARLGLSLLVLSATS